MEKGALVAQWPSRRWPEPFEAAKKRTWRSPLQEQRRPSDPAPSRTFNAMPSSSISGVRDAASSLRLPEASYRERNRSIARAYESVNGRKRGCQSLVWDASDFG